MSNILEREIETNKSLQEEFKKIKNNVKEELLTRQKTREEESKNQFAEILKKMKEMEGNAPSTNEPSAEQTNDGYSVDGYFDSQI